MWLAEKSGLASQENTEFPPGPPGLDPAFMGSSRHPHAESHNPFQGNVLPLTGGLAPSSQHYARPDLWLDQVHA